MIVITMHFDEEGEGIYVRDITFRSMLETFVIWLQLWWWSVANWPLCTSQWLLTTGHRLMTMANTSMNIVSISTLPTFDIADIMQVYAVAAAGVVSFSLTCCMFESDVVSTSMLRHWGYIHDKHQMNCTTTTGDHVGAHWLCHVPSWFGLSPISTHTHTPPAPIDEFFTIPFEWRICAQN